ncbi:MAG: SagB/ThcOx family dehydrogenase [Candidatus Cloacimonetes bacterium]|nr:SagB/ThcOx family dehydrogenase [Candidatus Cloacimonadota bacterium]
MGTRRKFLILLSDLSEEERGEFYGKYPADYKQWFSAQVSKLSAYTSAEKEDAEETISRILSNNAEEVEKLKIKIKDEKKRTKEYRELLKAGKEYGTSDQELNLPMPPMQKAYPGNSVIFDLPTDYKGVLQKTDILECINDRKSRRKFTEEELTLTELAYLLWSTQGVRKVVKDKANFRTVPSGGARQPFETYLIINQVTGLKPGIYRYLALEHKLLLIKEDDDLPDRMVEYAHGQKFVGYCAVCFIWTAVPYRMEWRYTMQAKKDILIEAGHVCQNLYLACESIKAGTCGIAAYDQEKVDELIGVDGMDEMTVYLAPVGRSEK